MYKKNQNPQITFENFNQPLGLKINPENRSIKKAEDIPWNVIEDKYASLFPSLTGTVAKPLRMALGSLIIQKEYGYADRKLVAQIQENPYYQYFVGLPGYRDAADERTTGLLAVIRKLYDQQKHMYDTKTHTVEDRIVSINQPYIRPREH